MLVGKMWVLLSARANQLRLSHRIFINMQYNQPRPFSRHVHRSTLMHPLLQVLQDLKPGRVILCNSLSGQTNQVQVDYYLFYLVYKRKNMNHEFRSKIMKAWGNIFRQSAHTHKYLQLSTPLRIDSEATKYIKPYSTCFMSFLVQVDFHAYFNN